MWEIVKMNASSKTCVISEKEKGLAKLIRTAKVQQA